MPLRGHRPSHQGVLTVDQVHHFLRRTQVDVPGILIDALRRQPCQIVIHATTSNSFPLRLSYPFGSVNNISHSLVNF